MAVFDDEQIADDKSIANMKIKYAGIENVFAQQKQESNNEEELLNLGKLVKKANKFFELEEKHFDEFVKDFFYELQAVNMFELDELKEAYSSLENLEKLTPDMVEKPVNLEDLHQKLAKNEILALEKLLKIRFKENDEKNKKMLERMIFRRVGSLLKMFFD